MPAEDLVRLGLAHVPEGRGVIGELTVDGEPAPGRALAPGPRGPAQALDEVYDAVPAAGRAPPRCRASTLSGGERQMLVDRPGADGPAASCCCSTSRRSGWRRWSTAQIMALLRRLRDAHAG